MKNQIQKISAFLKQDGMELSLDTKVQSDAHQQTQYVQPSSKKSIPDQITQEVKSKQFAACSKKQVPNKQKNISFEQQFGASFSVWIGGIALALAGFFMIKYSIETGLLNETVRIVLGLIFGCLLLYSANLVRSKPQFANGIRIAQALSGAGIADLYFCIFAATSIYDLIHTFIGFVGMATVTATAVILSIRHGMPIALLGLIGGFLTPAMVGSQNPQSPILFIYLYFVVTGLMMVIRKQCWWLIAIPTVLGSFLWVCIWLFGSNFIPSDTIWLGLFLMAVSTTVVIISKQQHSQDIVDITDLYKVTSVLNYLTLGGVLLLTGKLLLAQDLD
ncbi:DUF2339 domain-containing protein [Wolbachia endosymbiont of Pentidionis agamae]|uniref:DUF2339 domain-containing protein n=1 Tax=Wolbachia endosymbiont of Pentidionis agamae TaxID=3110435 RepID=UPI002FD0E28B